MPPFMGERDFRPLTTGSGPEMDVQLEDWRSRGRSYDYLGFEVFYR